MQAILSINSDAYFLLSGTGQAKYYPGEPQSLILVFTFYSHCSRLHVGDNVCVRPCDMSLDIAVSNHAVSLGRP